MKKVLIAVLAVLFLVGSADAAVRGRQVVRQRTVIRGGGARGIRSNVKFRSNIAVNTGFVRSRFSSVSIGYSYAPQVVVQPALVQAVAVQPAYVQQVIQPAVIQQQVVQEVVPQVAYMSAIIQPAVQLQSLAVAAPYASCGLGFSSGSTVRTRISIR